MSYSVMIVEDDPMVAMINEQYVKKNSNFNICASFRNGQDAINYLANNKVDLVILDVYMPVMNGIETLQKIREMNVGAEVIMVTAANDTSTLENTMHLGVIDYLIKPFAFERFVVALEKFSAKKEALEKTKVMDQHFVDNLISNQKEKIESKLLPKGIQEKTLETIIAFLKNTNSWVDGEAISENVGLSGVTVRHYMSYLSKNNIVKESINYETGGRPRSLYKWNG